jgi:hypothetical protein
MRKIGVLILGTYRSGTSALTGVMHRLGFESNTVDLQIDNLEYNPTGSYRDIYLSGSFVINWEEYFALKGVNDKWCAKHHNLYSNNNIQEYIDNFPADRESWLIWTKRPVEKSIDSYLATSKLLTAEQDINNLYEKTQDIYNVWDDKKIIVEFSELLGNTEQTVRMLSATLGVDYNQTATDFIDANHSQFGGI